MRATEGLACFNGECNPCTAEGAVKLSHLNLEEAKSLRKLGLKAGKSVKKTCKNCFHNITKSCTTKLKTACSYWYSPEAKDDEQGLAYQPWQPVKANLLFEN
ncbi:MAG: hypothetical protein PHY56_04135 [Candidatus Omnitrophica bacterium]|nr:hypothetical protein [Candidatus Omnitrophota bacterium]